MLKVCRNGVRGEEMTQMESVLKLTEKNFSF